MEPTLSEIGEIQLINRIKKALGEVNPPLPFGIGDDCAVVSADARGRVGVVTCDSVVCGRHFNEDTAATAVGGKLVNRNLSDLAAMGAVEPGHGLLALVTGGDLSVRWLLAFIEGVRGAASRASLKIVGGDVSMGEPGTFAAVLSVHGYAERPIPRAAARPGDSLWVTGCLGGSILGRHLTFSPRLDEARWLAEHLKPVAMIDLTDGLAKDLPALVGSGVAGIRSGAIPISDAAMVLARTSGRSPEEHAFADGEDYELAFALSRDDADWVEAWQARFPGVRVTRIGRVVAVPPSEPKPTLVDLETGRALQWEGGGYQHFQ